MATEIDILQLPTAEVIQAAQTAAVDAAAGAETARADAVAAAELAAQSSALDEDGKLKVSAIPEYLEEASLSNTIDAVVAAEVPGIVTPLVAPAVGANVGTFVSTAALPVRGTRFAACGDSITDGAGSTNTAVDSYRAQLGKILGGATANVIDHGVPGESAAGLRVRVPAIIAEGPALAGIMIGTNPSTSIAQYKIDVAAILDMFAVARIPVIMYTIPPKGAGATDAAVHRERVNTQNMWLRYECDRRGIPMSDVFAALVDPLTGYFQTAYDADGTHPTPAGHLAIAKAVAPIVRAVVPRRLAAVVAPGAPGLIANPLMAGGGASTAPTGWASGGTTGVGTVAVGTVSPVAGDGLPAGDWMRLAVDNTGQASSTTAVRHHNLTTPPAAGDIIEITAHMKTAAGSETRCALQWNDGATILGAVYQSGPVTDPGAVLRYYVLASAPATPRIRFTVTAAAGATAECFVGAVQVRNLTALGLAELAS